MDVHRAVRDDRGVPASVRPALRPLAAGLLVVGVLFGLAGGLAREGGISRAVAGGILAGGLVAESLLLWTLWDGASAHRAVLVQLAVAALLAALLAGRPRLAPLTASVALAATGVLWIGELTVRELLRTSGWGGA